MASASSKSARNLFADSKRRLAERIAVNVNNAGSVVRQAQRGSKPQPAASARAFCQTEATMEASFDGLQRAQLLMAQLARQQEQIEANLKKVPVVKEQVQDMER